MYHYTSILNIQLDVQIQMKTLQIQISMIRTIMTNKLALVALEMRT